MRTTPDTAPASGPAIDLHDWFACESALFSVLLFGPLHLAKRGSAKFVMVWQAEACRLAESSQCVMAAKDRNSVSSFEPLTSSPLPISSSFPEFEEVLLTLILFLAQVAYCSVPFERLPPRRYGIRLMPSLSQILKCCNVHTQVNSRPEA